MMEINRNTTGTSTVETTNVCRAMHGAILLDGYGLQCRHLAIRRVWTAT